MKTVWVVQKEDFTKPRYIIGMFDTLEKAIAKVKALKSYYTNEWEYYENEWEYYETPHSYRHWRNKDVYITLTLHGIQ